nr:hypothetical protein [Tanacetum cinerariifolium]
MVAYLRKPTGSEGFQEIVDFLNGNHIRTIYNEEQQITATIDGKEFSITKASVRIHLQLADAQGGSPRCQEAMRGFIAQTSMTLQELTVLCTTLSQKVESLEADLKQTKQVYGAAYTKLIVKVSTQEEAQSQESQLKDQLGVLSVAKVLADAAKVHTYSRRRGQLVLAVVELVLSLNQCRPRQKDNKNKKLGLETAVRVQEEFDEEERQRIARVYATAQTFTKEEWKNIRARVEAELTQRLQAEEREKYSDVDRAKMLVDLINQRKRYFAEQKAEAKRKNPMTQAQQRTYMSNYIKHMGSYTLKQLQKLSFDEINELFETTMRSIEDSVPFESEGDKAVPKLVEARSSKRDGEKEIDLGSSKKQKTSEASGLTQEQPDEEEKELSQEDLQQLTIIISEQRMNVEALQVKYPIIDWDIYTEDSRKYWKILKVGNHIEVYQFFNDMLKVFDTDDLVQLWSLVKERFSSTEPTDDKERVLWVELKRLFEPDTDDELWELQRYMHDPLTWRCSPCVYRERNGYFHANRERISII